MIEAGEIAPAAAPTVAAATPQPTTYINPPPWMKFPAPPAPWIKPSYPEPVCAAEYRLIGENDVIMENDEYAQYVDRPENPGWLTIPNDYWGKKPSQLGHVLRRPISKDAVVLPAGFRFREPASSYSRINVPYGFAPLAVGMKVIKADLYHNGTRFVPIGGLLGHVMHEGDDYRIIRHISKMFGLRGILSDILVDTMEAAPHLPSVSVMILNETGHLYPPVEVRGSFETLSKWVLDNYNQSGDVAGPVTESSNTVAPAGAPAEAQAAPAAPPTPALVDLDLPEVEIRQVQTFYRTDRIRRTETSSGFSLDAEWLKDTIEEAIEDGDDFDWIQRTVAEHIDGTAPSHADEQGDLNEVDSEVIRYGDEDEHNVEESSATISNTVLNAHLKAWCRTHLTPAQLTSLGL